jgi:hypothetical protein
MPSGFESSSWTHAEPVSFTAQTQASRSGAFPSRVNGQAAAFVKGLGKGSIGLRAKGGCVDGDPALRMRRACS